VKECAGCAVAISGRGKTGLCQPCSAKDTVCRMNAGRTRESRSEGQRRVMARLTKEERVARAAHASAHLPPVGDVRWQEREDRYTPIQRLANQVRLAQNRPSPERLRECSAARRALMTPDEIEDERVRLSLQSRRAWRNASPETRAAWAGGASERGKERWAKTTLAERRAHIMKMWKAKTWEEVCKKAHHRFWHEFDDDQRQMAMTAMNTRRGAS